MRILVGADVFPDPNSGAAGTVYHTNQALKELGHQVDEIWAPALGRRIQHGNLHYLLELPYRYRQAVAKKTANTRYDVIQLSQPHAYLAAVDHRRHSRPGVFVNRSHGLELRANPVLRSWHKEMGICSNRFPRTLLSPLLSRLLNRHWLQMSRLADGIILPCKDDRRFLLRHTDIDSERVRVIHHGIPDSFLRRRAMPIDRSRVQRWLYVGQLAFFKGPNLLAAAISELLAGYPDVSFTWVCSRQHHAEARALLNPSVLKQVRFVDWLPQNRLMEIYDEHGIFLYPSLVEGAGKAVLEAMSRGMCVATSETSGMAEARALLNPSVLKQVRFVDWLPQNRLMEIYDEHGIFLYPSLVEGAGKAVLEAMSRGMCVATSETSGMKDYIENERSGILVEVGSVEGFVGAVHKLMKDTETCRKMGLEARSAAEQYSWRRCAQECVEFYRFLQARKTAPEHPSESGARNAAPIERCPSRC